MSNIRTYSPENVTVNWGGKFNFTGFADGTFITMTRSTPRTDVVVGAKGDNAITKSANYSGTVEVTLLQNSPTNEYLTYIMNVEDTSGELTRAPIEVIDPSGAVLSIAQRCHIQEPAPTTLGDGQNAKTWVFYTENLQYLALPNGILNEQAVKNAAEIYGAIKGVSDTISGVSN